MNTPSDDPVFRKYEDKLAPYLQGTLPADEVQALEAFADTSAEFREMLQFEKQILGGVRSGGTAAAPSFSVLRERLGQERQNPVTRFLEAAIEGLRSVFMPLVLASAAAVIALQFVGLQDGAEQDSRLADAPFETYADGDVPQRSADRRYFRLALAEDAGDTALAALSREFGFRVESAADSIGSYEISVAMDVVPNNETLRQWRQDGRILMLEPIQSGTAEP